jgi:hypothetical protein
MSRFRYKAFCALVALLALLAPGSGGAGERVLCFGDDGHISLEAATNGVCGPGGISVPARDEVSSARAGYAVKSRQTCCGSCVDVPVLGNDSGRCVSPLVFHKADPVPFAGGAPAGLAGSPLSGTPAGFLHSPIRHDLPDPISISLRKTILLI